MRHRVVGLLGALFVGAAPALAGPPFLTDDPEPVDCQHWEIIMFSQGTNVQGATTATLPGVEVNYGALPNLQLHVMVPLGYENTTGSEAGFAPGDTELGAKYRFVTPGDGDWFPQVAIFPQIEMPTGNQKLGFSTGHAQAFLPVWLQKDFDPWSIYGGGGYWINPGFGNRDSWFFGTALWRQFGQSLHLGAEVFHQTATTTLSRDSTGFNLGVTYDLSDTWHLLGSAGTGLQNGTATNRFSSYLGLQLTF